MHKTTFQLEAEIAALIAERTKLMQDVDTALNLQAHAQRAEAEALERVAELEAALAARATPAQPTEKPLAWLATDLDGHGDVAFTQEEAKRRAGESCTYFYPLYDIGDTANQKWISVKDRLPEIYVYDDSACMLDGRSIPPAIHSKRVLVALDDGTVREDRLDGLQGNTPFWASFRERVVAWQLMPAAPSIAQDGQKSEADHGA